MYRLVKYVGKDGTDKLARVAEMHSLEGSFYQTPYIGTSIYFIYNDLSGKMLASSTIEAMQTADNRLEIVTRNSIFVFEKVEESNE